MRPDSAMLLLVAEACNKADKSVIPPWARGYVISEVNCIVDWASETAGTRGSIYSAHLQCSGATDAPRSQTVLLPKLPSKSRSAPISVASKPTSVVPQENRQPRDRVFCDKLSGS
jgi:hypothetical protein